jgi:hypothetical protein
MPDVTLFDSLSGPPALRQQPHLQYLRVFKMSFITNTQVDIIESPKETSHGIIITEALGSKADIHRFATPAKAHVRSTSFIDPTPPISRVNSSTRLANRYAEEEAARASRRHTLRVIGGFVTCFTTGWADGGALFLCSIAAQWHKAHIIHSDWCGASIYQAAIQPHLYTLGTSFHCRRYWVSSTPHIKLYQPCR